MIFSNKRDFTNMRLSAFREWLTSRGVSILANTNEYEVLRFQTNIPGVSVLYRRKTGHFTLTGEMKTAWEAFRAGQEFNTGIKTPRRKTRTKIHKVIITTLLERDGSNCFYCHKPLLEDRTLEHLLSLSHGGSNHISNLVLAHAQCNQQAGHLSLVEKIRLRESTMCFSTCAYSHLLSLEQP